MKKALALHEGGLAYTLRMAVSIEMHHTGGPEQQRLSKQEELMSNQHSVTKRHRRPKSGKRADYTARTMAAVKQLEQAAKIKVKAA